MSETTSGYIGAGNYRLHAPDRRAYDPTALEVTIANQLGGPGANQLTGYMFGAQLDRRGSADNYTLALQDANAAAMTAGDRAEQAAVLRERMKMLGAFAGHPESASLYSLTSNELAPDARNVAAGYSLAGLSGRQAQAFERYGAGLNHMDEAGLRLPDGATIGPDGRPTGPLTQGESRSVRAAGVSAAGGGGHGTTPEERAANQAIRVRAQAEGYARQQGAAAAAQVMRGMGVNSIVVGDTAFPVAGSRPLTPEEHAKVDAARETAQNRYRVEYIQRVAPHLAAGAAAAGAPAPVPSATTAPPAAPQVDMNAIRQRAMQHGLRTGDEIGTMPNGKHAIRRNGVIVAEFD